MTLNSSSNSLDFLDAEHWTSEQCGDWLLEGLKTGLFPPLSYSTRSYPYASSLLLELFEVASGRAQTIFRNGVGAALRMWQLHDGLSVLRELAILATYTRCLLALESLRTTFDRDLSGFDSEQVYQLQSNIIYSMRGLTQVNDTRTNNFFKRLYDSPRDYRLISQLVLGLIESRAEDETPQVLQSYIRRYLETVKRYPEYYDEGAVENFFLSLVDVLTPEDIYATMRVAGSEIERILNRYIFENYRSRYVITYDNGSFFVGNGNTKVPVPEWFLKRHSDTFNDRQSAYNEDRYCDDDAVGRVLQVLEVLI